MSRVQVKQALVEQGMSRDQDNRHLEWSDHLAVFTSSGPPVESPTVQSPQQVLNKPLVIDQLKGYFPLGKNRLKVSQV